MKRGKRIALLINSLINSLINRTLFLTLLTTTLSFSFITLNANAAGSSTVDNLLSVYKADASLPFSAARGEAFWNQTHPGKNPAKKRSCTSCHSADLKLPGKHVKTGKQIDAMAVSVNQERLQKTRKIEKWFKRNCKWTLGRECNTQEKGDVLVYLQQQ